MWGMNLQSIITPEITSVVPESPISLFIYNGYVNDAAGNITNSYTEFDNLLAQVQLENKQNLIHLNGFNASKIYKRFYIQSYTLTGLNRNISTGGDYIEMVVDGNTLYYKIVEVKENFRVGWVCIVGAESTSIDDKS